MALALIISPICLVLPKGVNGNLNSNEQKPTKEKKIERVTTSEVKTKKKSPVVLFANRIGLVPEDIEDVKEYIVREQIIPTFKNLFFDILHAIIFGGTDPRDSYRRSGSRTSYESYWDKGNRRDDRNRRGKTINFNYDDIIFDTRADVENVLDAMSEAMYRYDDVSVWDFYEFAGISDCPYTYRKYGWDEEDDINKAKVIRASNGYIIKLPRPRSLDR